MMSSEGTIETPHLASKEVSTELLIEQEHWHDPLAPADGWFATICEAASQKVPALRHPFCALLTDDHALQQLNKNFRNLDKPTNVLSFPAHQGQHWLGDIAIAFETCAREADEKGIAIRAHATHLLVHGMLHLVGYDHQKEEDAHIMEALEADILATLNIKNPYQDNNEAN